MTSRHRVRTAIERRKPDRVPVDFWAARETWDNLCRHFAVGSKDELLDMWDIDLRFVIGPSIVGLEMEEEPDAATRDLWGVARKSQTVQLAHGSWTYRHVSESPLAGAETAADVDRYDHWPSADWWDYSALRAQCEAAGDRAVVCAGDRLDRTAQLKTMMYLRGTEQIYVDLALNADIVDAMISHIVAYFLDYNRRVFEEAGDLIDIFMMGDDFGTQAGPMFDVGTWRRFLRKGFKAYIDLAHEYGIKVMHHTCGSVVHLIGDFIECGLDILQSVQPKAKDMDLAKLKREFGNDIAFHGGLDIQELIHLSAQVAQHSFCDLGTVDHVGYFFPEADRPSRQLTNRPYVPCRRAVEVRVGLENGFLQTNRAKLSVVVNAVCGVEIVPVGREIIKQQMFLHLVEKRRAGKWRKDADLE